MTVLQTVALPLGYVTVWSFLKTAEALASAVYRRSRAEKLPHGPNRNPAKRIRFGKEEPRSTAEEIADAKRLRFLSRAEGIPTLERVTRLELATSTLARWRSTR